MEAEDIYREYDHVIRFRFPQMLIVWFPIWEGKHGGLNSDRKREQTLVVVVCDFVFLKEAVVIARIPCHSHTLSLSSTATETTNTFHMYSWLSMLILLSLVLPCLPI